MRPNRYNNYNNTNLARKLDTQTTTTPLEQPQVQTKVAEERNVLIGGKALLLVFTVAAFAFTMVARSNTMVVAGNDLVKLRQQEATLIRENDLLRLEVNKLKSPERINTIAKNTLGMTIAKQNIYINKDAKKQ